MAEFKQGSFWVSLAVGALLASAARANPSGPAVINGQVTFDASQAGVLDISNSPNAIIEWQGFSINASEVTRFIQQNADSAVLNRVVGQDPSMILGQLLSNGQVFLINPNGVIFGQGSMVDTAGLLASTLSLSNDDFLRGNYLFVNPGSGGIENYGMIHVGNGGSVVLVSPNIENSGLIQSDGGHLVLAAGQQLTLTSMDAPQVRFEIQAPTDKVLNIGQLMANGGGSIDVFAGAIESSGTISADSVEVDKNGQIHLVAQGDITLDAASKTSANGPSGGTVVVQSQSGTASVSGVVEAKGSDGVGGTVEVLGRNVGLFDNASVDASGQTGGGTVRLGGDRQGTGETQRAEFTYIGENTQVHADALDSGDGGTVIAYADDTARIYGHLSARGGASSGNGGFVETSGKKGFEILNTPDTGASNGTGGEWLIDPYNIDIVSGSTSNISPLSVSSAFTSTGAATIDVSLIASSLSSGGTVTITTGSGGGDAGDINWKATLDMSSVSYASTAKLSLQAYNNINFLSGGIINGSSKPLNLELWADTDGVNGGQVYFYSGSLDLGSGWLHVLQGANATGGTLDFYNSEPVTITAGGGIKAGTLGIWGGSLSVSGTASNPQQFANPVTLNGPVTVNDLSLWGELDSNSDITVNGIFTWIQGVIGGSGGSLATNGTTTIDKYLAELTGRRTWTNYGTINWSGSSLAAINLWDSATLRNQGSMNLLASSSRLGGNTSGGLLNGVGGEITVGSSTAFDVPIKNAGTFNFLGGSSDILGSFTNIGAINVYSSSVNVSGAFSNDGSVILDGGGMRVGSSGTDNGIYVLNNKGWLVFDGGSGAITRTFDGAISSSDKTGKVGFGNGVFDVNSGLNVGWVGIDASGTVNIAGDYNSNTQTHIEGALNVTGAYTQLADGATHLDYGTLTAASVTVNGGTSATNRAFALSGSGNGGAGAFDGAGTVNLNGGTFTNSGGVYIWGGPLAIDGNYVQTASGELGIGLSSPAAYGLVDSYAYSTALYSSTVAGALNVSGSAAVDGALSILWDGLGGSSYRAIDAAGGLSGGFSTMANHPTGLALDYLFDGQGLTVSVAGTSGTATSTSTGITTILVSSEPVLQETIFDRSTDNILATTSSTSTTTGMVTNTGVLTTTSGEAGGFGGGEVGAPKACKK